MLKSSIKTSPYYFPKVEKLIYVNQFELKKSMQTCEIRV